VQENSGIFIDASSTCYCFAQYLAQRSDFRLTLVTSSPSIPLLFEACPQFRIISTGGELHQMLNAYGGPMAMRLLESMNFDSAFISCAGFDVAHGAKSDSPVLVEMLHSASMRAREIVLLADSAKFSRLAMMTTLRAKEITKIVTDRGIDNDILRRIQDAGIEVTIAGSETTDSSSSPSETADNDIDVEQTSSNLSKQAQGIKENDHAC
jgi:DeoR/GlpR family transcriptional regulator of sugar metabolism